MTHTGGMRLGLRTRLIAIASAVLIIVGALSIGGVLAFGPLFPAANAQPTVDLVSKKTVARSLTSPWGLAFLPDGSALVSERDTGLVRRIAGQSNGSPARSLTKTSTVGTVSGVRAGGEGGLLGIAVPPTPRGTQPEVIFAYLTTARDNRVVRIGWDGRSLGRQTPIVTGIPKNTYHNGGRILVDDDVLYIATGDAGIGTRARPPHWPARSCGSTSMERPRPATPSTGPGSSPSDIATFKVSHSTRRDDCGPRSSARARPTNSACSARDETTAGRWWKVAAQSGDSPTRRSRGRHIYRVTEWFGDSRRCRLRGEPAWRSPVASPLEGHPGRKAQGRRSR